MESMDEPEPTRLTYNEAVLKVAEFIEAAIHSILYIRQVYPVEAFVRRKKFDTPVYQARHPALSEYITGVMNAFIDELQSGNLRKLILIIKDSRTETPLERFVFGMERVVDVNETNLDLPVSHAMSEEGMNQSFRKFFIKLNMLDAMLGDTELGDEISFAVIIELRNSLTPEVDPEENGNDSLTWMAAERDHSTHGVPRNAEMHMVRGINTGIINLALGVQETDAKLHPEKHHRPPPKRRPVPKTNTKVQSILKKDGDKKVESQVSASIAASTPQNQEEASKVAQSQTQTTVSGATVAVSGPSDASSSLNPSTGESEPPRPKLKTRKSVSFDLPDPESQLEAPTELIEAEPIENMKPIVPLNVDFGAMDGTSGPAKQ